MLLLLRLEKDINFLKNPKENMLEKSKEKHGNSVRTMTVVNTPVLLLVIKWIWIIIYQVPKCINARVSFLFWPLNLLLLLIYYNILWLLREYLFSTFLMCSTILSWNCNIHILNKLLQNTRKRKINSHLGACQHIDTIHQKTPQRLKRKFHYFIHAYTFLRYDLSTKKLQSYIRFVLYFCIHIIPEECVRIKQCN